MAKTVQLYRVGNAALDSQKLFKMSVKPVTHIYC